MPKKIFNSDLETSGAVKATSITDGTATISGGVLTASTITDGTATISGGVLTASTISTDFCTIGSQQITGVNANFTLGSLSDGNGLVECNGVSTQIIYGEDRFNEGTLTSYGYISVPTSRFDTNNTNSYMKLKVDHYENIAEVVEGDAQIELETIGRADSANQTSKLEVNSTDGIWLYTTKGPISLDGDIKARTNTEIVVRDKLSIKRDLVSGNTESSRYPYIEAQYNDTSVSTEPWDLYITAGVPTTSVSGASNTLILDNRKISIGHVDDPFMTFDDSQLYAKDRIVFNKGVSFDNTTSIEGSLYITSIAEEPATPNDVPTSSTHDLVIHATQSDPTHLEPTFQVFRAASSAFTGLHNYIAEDSSNLAVGDAVGLVNNRLVHLGANSPICVGIVATTVASENSVRTSLGENELPEGCTVYYTASVGDSKAKGCQGFNVCNENGDIQPGDLLVTSSTPGYLMKQDDDIIRSKTVGKAMEAVTFDDNGQATGVYGFIYCG